MDTYPMKKQAVADIKKTWVVQNKEDGTVAINGYKGDSICWVIPSYVGRKKVSSIGHRAFRPKSHKARRKLYRNVQHIVLPDTIKSIGSQAFEDCRRLQAINLPDGIEGIGDSAFNGCISLENISIPSSLNSLDACLFSGCVSLKEVIIPHNITWIANGAFSDCESLQSINIPKSVSDKKIFI